MSGWEKTTKTLKMVENIENCLNRISKGSRSMFARQPDMILHCKQSCKARFKNDKNLGNICLKVSDIGPKGLH